MTKNRPEYTRAGDGDGSGGVGNKNDEIREIRGKCFRNGVATKNSWGKI